MVKTPSSYCSRLENSISSISARGGISSPYSWQALRRSSSVGFHRSTQTGLPWDDSWTVSTRFSPGSAAKSDQRSVTVLVFATTAARTGSVALGLAPGAGIVGVRRRIGIQRQGSSHFVFAGQRIDVAGLHLWQRPGLQHRRRRPGLDLHMHQLLHHVGLDLVAEGLEHVERFHLVFI